MSDRTDTHTNEPVIEVDALSHRFGRNTVLDSVDVQVPRGSVTALLGRNGEGKTTLLRLMTGWLRPRPGHVRVLGMDPARRGPDIRRVVGYVPDQLEVPRWMRVADWYRFVEPFFPTWSRDEERALCERLGLDPTAKVHTLSKGQRAKHALIAALSHRPELLLLDEPFSGLDPIVRHEVLTAILGHLREEGRTIVVVSHSIGDVERIADRVVLLEKGRVRLDADLEELQRSAVRFSATLRDGDAIWSAPGAPAVERTGADVVLTYLDFHPAYEQALQADPKVAEVRRLNRDLEDVFRAAARETQKPHSRNEVQPCAM
jgi:ABC-2 type transport system ATP-binding protein